MVRGYILTESDRKIINKYLKEKVALRRLDMIKHLTKKYYPALKEDLRLIEQFLKEVEG